MASIPPLSIANSFAGFLSPSLILPPIRILDHNKDPECLELLYVSISGWGCYLTTLHTIQWNLSITDT